jgi:hypothetical protein
MRNCTAGFKILEEQTHVLCPEIDQTAKTWLALGCDEISVQNMKQALEWSEKL